MKKSIFIYSAPRPVWQRILAALLYTFCIYSLYLFFENSSIDLLEKNYKSFAAPIQMAVISGGFAVYFSLVNDLHFDIENGKYKRLYRIGPFEFGKWVAFKKLQYISIFSNNSSSIKLNLWYNQNRYFTIAVFDEFEDALSTSKEVAKKLQLDLLDAVTDPRDSKWVDLDS